MTSPDGMQYANDRSSEGDFIHSPDITGHAHRGSTLKARLPSGIRLANQWVVACDQLTVLAVVKINHAWWITFIARPSRHAHVNNLN